MVTGLLAGSGSLPIEFLKGAKRKGEEVKVFAIEGITEREVESLSETIWIKPFKLGKLLKEVKRKSVSRIAILGKVEHRNALSLRNLDLKAASILLSLKDRKPETIIGKLIEELEKIGVNVIDPTPFISHLIAEKGVIWGELSESLMEEARFGMKVAKEVASLDIGQTVVVKERIVVAVEGIEGTDRCIERGAKLCGGGFVVCKAARRNQDMRVDVPTVGPKTVELMGKLGAKALFVEAGKTFIIDAERLKETAKRYNVTVVAV